VVGVCEGTLPITYAESPTEVEEERRLLYVGATRARRHLALSWALARAAGGRRSRKPSRFLDGVRPASPRRAAAPTGKQAAAPVAAEDAELFERLREWRRQVAAETGMPPYIVFSDRTLAAIASVRPSSPSELAAISGVGPKKLSDYAAAVLDVVRSA
jgi:DNA helicase-2/ATP-dependent DNA helicase PcrA